MKWEQEQKYLIKQILYWFSILLDNPSLFLPKIVLASLSLPCPFTTRTWSRQLLIHEGKTPKTQGEHATVICTWPTSLPQMHCLTFYLCSWQQYQSDLFLLNCLLCAEQRTTALHISSFKPYKNPSSRYHFHFKGEKSAFQVTQDVDSKVLLLLFTFYCGRKFIKFIILTILSMWYSTVNYMHVII